MGRKQAGEQPAPERRDWMEPRLNWRNVLDDSLDGPPFFAGGSGTKRRRDGFI